MNLYIGTLYNDEVLGKKVTLESGNRGDFLHRENGYHYGLKWRYNIETKELFCWEPPNDLEKDLIKDFLEKRGQKVENVIYTRWNMTLEDLKNAKNKKEFKIEFDLWSNTVNKHHNSENSSTLKGGCF